MMSKLEQKLIELGYEKLKFYDVIGYIWWKKCIAINTNGVVSKILDSELQISSIKIQQDIDNLQQAFNELQKDLEILKECEG